MILLAHFLNPIWSLQAHFGLHGPGWSIQEQGKVHNFLVITLFCASFSYIAGDVWEGYQRREWRIHLQLTRCFWRWSFGKVPNTHLRQLWPSPVGLAVHYMMIHLLTVLDVSRDLIFSRWTFGLVIWIHSPTPTGAKVVKMIMNRSDGRVRFSKTKKEKFQILNNSVKIKRCAIHH